MITLFTCFQQDTCFDKMKVTRDQAICMFFCEEHNNENVARLGKRIEEMEDLELCYLQHPTDPVLVSIRLINTLPSKYHLYPLLVEGNCG